MVIFYLSIGFVYVFALFFFGRKWGKTAVSEIPSPIDQKVSVLIPFRNEEKNLPIIFQSIENLNFFQLEVLWIDDHSEDDSALILGKLLDHSNPKFIHKVIQSSGRGKKSALKHGVEAATGGVIFTTDADCMLPESWVIEMLKPFSDPQIQFVAGPVMTKENGSFFQRFQQIEWASILLVTKVAFEKQSPLMCSGANLAYRKEAFLSVNGYFGNEEILSGDDEFLMKKIVAFYDPKALVYLEGFKNLVFTNSLTRWSELYSQRIRWASKWKSHSLIHSVFSSVPVCYQLLWVSSLFLPFFEGKFGLLALLVVWILKIGIEYSVLKKVTDSYGLRLSFKDFFITSLIHPIYVLKTAIGAIKGRFEWKGRSVN
ncbi:glycosyltransferase [Belliella sp. DSM 107340]|uniref:Glycosyltransferase n=1 Tax=Belliella calami TaxID=2923436 RepID=A0ABS9UJM7_9BACT|nr:glycosyltransferase [Belliella calami]MCH7396792.1 glycosyltransferase [Belliella calami]